jgi:hypothetical protein
MELHRRIRDSSDIQLFDIRKWQICKRHISNIADALDGHHEQHIYNSVSKRQKQQRPDGDSDCYDYMLGLLSSGDLERDGHTKFR